ncbi:MAG: glycine zipper domain-containing protein [Planctomycetales bacterium]|nr:glycine zipper domain-containing protein [Planctomycetales bacterium]
MTRTPFRLLLLFVFAPAGFCSTGCNSPYHSDRGALFGGLLGAGTGAIVGNQLGNTGAGAAIGAGVGALGGAAVGNELDQIEARNRAMIAQQLGRQVAPGAVAIDDVIAMTAAGVSEELIVNHVRANGMVAPLQTNDLIRLQQQGVSTRVVAAMQEPPRQTAAPVVVQQPGPTPVIVEHYDYGPYWGPRYYRPYPYRRHRPGMSWGVAVGN